MFEEAEALLQSLPAEFTQALDAEARRLVTERVEQLHPHSHDGIRNALTVLLSAFVVERLIMQARVFGRGAEPVVDYIMNQAAARGCLNATAAIDTHELWERMKKH